MKTQPLPKALPLKSELTLAEEVLFSLSGAQPRRTLLATALVAASQGVMAGMAFEVHSLNHQPLLRLQGKTLSGDPSLLAAVADLEPLLRDMLAEGRKAAFVEFNAQLAKESTVSSP